MVLQEKLVHKKISNGVQVGAKYDANNIIAAIAFGRTNYRENIQPNVSLSGRKQQLEGVLSTLGYRFSDLGLLVSLDSGYAKTKNHKEMPSRSRSGSCSSSSSNNCKPPYDEKRYFVSPGFQYELMEDTNVYGNFKYERTSVNQGKKNT